MAGERRSLRSWWWSLLAAFITSGLGVAINVATNNVGNWWPWLIVVALSVGAAVTTRATADPASGRSAAQDPAPAAPRSVKQQITIGRSDTTNIAGRDLTITSRGEESHSGE
jgi:hypothetical protein